MNPGTAVLVVEKDPMMMWEAMDLAEEAGFVVFGAANASEALALLEAHDEIRILFTDIDIPGSMDGLRLSWAVRDRWPPVTIIVTSGIPDANRADLPSGSHFFTKPVHPRTLIRALQSACVVG